MTLTKTSPSSMYCMSHHVQTAKALTRLSANAQARLSLLYSHPPEVTCTIITWAMSKIGSDQRTRMEQCKLAPFWS